MTQSGGGIGDYSGQGWAPKQGPQNCKCGHGRRPHLPACAVLGCLCGSYEPDDTDGVAR